MLDPDKTCAVFISVVCNYTLYCLHWFHLVGAAAGKCVSIVTWCAPATQVFCTQFRPFPCWPQTLSPRTPSQLPSESFAQADCAWLHFWSPFRNPHVSFSHHNCGQSESGLLAGRPGITCTPRRASAGPASPLARLQLSTWVTSLLGSRECELSAVSPSTSIFPHHIGDLRTFLWMY